LQSEARAVALDAVALSREVGDPGGIADALLNLAYLDAAEPLPQRRRRALADEALALARVTGDKRRVALALMEQASAIPPSEASPELEATAAALNEIGGTRVLAAFYSSVAYNAIKEGTPELANLLLREATADTARFDVHGLVFLRGNEGLAALLTSDLERAQVAFQDQLRLCRAQAHWVAAEGLSGLAAIAARRGELERAACLLGAATATGPWDADADVAAQLEQHFFAHARQTFGERRWSEASTAGARLTLEEAIDYALAA
jgi:hypothetical protein